MFVGFFKPEKTATGEKPQKTDVESHVATNDGLAASILASATPLILLVIK